MQRVHSSILPKEVHILLHIFWKHLLAFSLSKRSTVQKISWNPKTGLCPPTKVPLLDWSLLPLKFLGSWERSVNQTKGVLPSPLVTGLPLHLLTQCTFKIRCTLSVASSEVAITAVQRGARMITHLFNAMPQLHHRDPSIIGLLGASPHLYSPTAITTHLPCNIQDPVSFLENSPPLVDGSQNSSPASLEAFSTIPSREGTLSSGAITPLNVSNEKKSRPSLHLEKGQIADMGFERPYYGLIVDGIHCHPNAVRVCIQSQLYFWRRTT